MPRSSARSGDRYGSYAITFIFRPSARSATMDPMLPQPMMPSVLPATSTPMNLDFSHLPAWVDALAAGIWRASAIISEMACSAVVMELPKGVFITTTPRAVAAATSTLSTPMPARPTTFRPLAAARISAVTLVDERMARPSYSPMQAASSSGVMPVLTSTSIPWSRKIAAALGLILSEISTFGIVMPPQGLKNQEIDGLRETAGTREHGRVRRTCPP